MKEKVFEAGTFNGWRGVIGANKARKHPKYIIKKDTDTIMLFFDNKGYYILKKYLDGRGSKVIR